jgi:hypothetical protein
MNGRLTSIEFAADSKLRIIGERAFGETGLESVEIPDGVDRLAAAVFSETSLRTIVFPKHLKTIETLAFRNCKNLNGIVIPASVVRIEPLAFAETSLRFVTISRYSIMKVLPLMAFANCPLLKSIILPAVIEVGKSNDPNCPKPILRPHGLNDIPEWSSECDLLNMSAEAGRGTLEFKSDVEVLTRECFEGNENCISLILDLPKVRRFASLSFCFRWLVAIDIPDSLEVIEERAFVRCFSLRSVSFGFDSVLREIGRAAFTRKRIQAIEFPASIEVIGPDAFNSCTDLKSVTFWEPSSLTVIEQGAFMGTGILTLAFPSSLKTIGASAFSWTFFLDRVKFVAPTSLEIIGPHAFSSSRVRKITDAGSIQTQPEFTISIPDSVLEIGNEVFLNCSAIQAVVFGPESRLVTLNGMTLMGIRTIRIPDTVIVIAVNAFFWCGHLQKIEFGNNSSLEEIQESAFYNAGLRCFHAPPSLKRVATLAFASCPLLHEVSFDKALDEGSLEPAIFIGRPPPVRAYVSYSEKFIRDTRRQCHHRMYLVPSKPK